MVISNRHAKVILVTYLDEITVDINAAQRVWEVQLEGFFIQHLEGTER